MERDEPQEGQPSRQRMARTGEKQHPCSRHLGRLAENAKLGVSCARGTRQKQQVLDQRRRLCLVCRLHDGRVQEAKKMGQPPRLGFVEQTILEANTE